MSAISRTGYSEATLQLLNNPEHESDLGWSKVPLIGIAFSWTACDALDQRIFAIASRADSVRWLSAELLDLYKLRKEYANADATRNLISVALAIICYLFSVPILGHPIIALLFTISFFQNVNSLATCNEEIKKRTCS